MSLKGKTVLITGGGSGAGANMALGFANADANVIIAGRRASALEKTANLHPSIRAISADVTDETSVKALFEQAGAVDIVIANAGSATSAPFTKTSLDDWNHMIAVNLTGVFLTLKYGLAQMQDWGRLIVVASTAGLKGYPYVAPYCASKHGAVGLIRALALETARSNITANAICPGFLDTEMTEQSIKNIQEKTGMNSQDAQKALIANNPQKRLIQPSEVTAAALWLSSPEAGSINGHSLSISGGEI